MFIESNMENKNIILTNIVGIDAVTNENVL